MSEAAETVEREAMEYDVVIVGAGPSGLAAAIRLKQLAAGGRDRDLGGGAGEGLRGRRAHPVGRGDRSQGHQRTVPGLEGAWARRWRRRSPRTSSLMLGPQGSLDLPMFAMPRLHAQPRQLHRLAGQRLPLAGASRPRRWASRSIRAWPPPRPVFDEAGALKGVVAGVFGIDKDGSHGPDYQPGIELHGKYVFIGEGVRGSLSKQLRAKFGLGEGADPEKYGIGLKELWQVPDEVFEPGLVQHTAGLAAGRQDRRRQLPLPLRRQLRGRRLRGAPELQEPLALALRRVPALQAPSRTSPSTWRAASASPTARAPSARAACSRCRGSTSRAACCWATAPAS